MASSDGHKNSALLNDLLDDLFAEAADQLGSRFFFDVIPVGRQHIEFARRRPLGADIGSRRNQIGFCHEILTFVGQHEVHQLARFFAPRGVFLDEHRPKGHDGSFLGVVNSKLFTFRDLTIGDVIDT